MSLSQITVIIIAISLITMVNIIIFLFYNPHHQQGLLQLRKHRVHQCNKEGRSILDNQGAVINVIITTIILIVSKVSCN